MKIFKRETTSWAGLFLWQCFARPLQIEQNLAHFNQFQNTLGSGLNNLAGRVKERQLESFYQNQLYDRMRKYANP